MGTMTRGRHIRTIRAAALHVAVMIALIGSVAGAVSAHGQARTRVFDPRLLESGDLIQYRDLSREDFLAKAPPAEVAEFDGNLGAATCAFLTTDPEMVIRATGSPDARGLTYAQVENLRFVAFMDRECSWWNPAPVSLPDDYILQHEQIHFAFFEVAARRLNRRAERRAGDFQTVSTTRQRAIDELHRRIDAEVQTAIAEIVRRSDALDEDTSRVARRDRQDWWWRRVSDELAQLDQGAREQLARGEQSSPSTASGAAVIACGPGASWAGEASSGRRST